MWIVQGTQVGTFAVPVRLVPIRHGRLSSERALPVPSSTTSGRPLRHTCTAWMCAVLVGAARSRFVVSS